MYIYPYSQMKIVMEKEIETVVMEEKQLVVKDVCSLVDGIFSL